MTITRYKYIITEEYCPKPEDELIPVPSTIAEEDGWYSLEQAKRDAESLMRSFDTEFQDEHGNTWKRVVRYYKVTTEEIEQ